VESLLPVLTLLIVPSYGYIPVLLTELVYVRDVSLRGYRLGFIGRIRVLADSKAHSNQHISNLWALCDRIKSLGGSPSGIQTDSLVPNLLQKFRRFV
jgi:hypothetical protein